VSVPHAPSTRDFFGKPGREPGEIQPVTFSVHGAIAEQYKVNPASLLESHASTIDYVIAATAG
jgi:hypothetical protein